MGVFYYFISLIFRLFLSITLVKKFLLRTILVLHSMAGANNAQWFVITGTDTFFGTKSCYMQSCDKLSKERCSNFVDNDDELFLRFCGMVDQRKTFTPYFHSEPLSEILSIANFRQTLSRISTCAESEFRRCWMRLCSSDNHCTMVPQKKLNWMLPKDRIKFVQACVSCCMLWFVPGIDSHWNCSFFYFKG